MFEQIFKNTDDVLREDAGCTSALDCTEQSSWLLLLKYLNALEADNATEALLAGRKHAFIELQKTFANSPKSRSVNAKTINPARFDLSVKNPNGTEAVTHRSPQKIMEEIAALDAKSAEVLANIRALL